MYFQDKTGDKTLAAAHKHIYSIYSMLQPQLKPIKHTVCSWDYHLSGVADISQETALFCIFLLQIEGASTSNVFSQIQTFKNVFFDKN